MSLTASTIISDVRTLLVDTDTPSPRWSDELLLQYLDQSQIELRRKRPDKFLNASDQTVALERITELTDNLKAPDESRETLVYLTAARVLSEDTTDTANIQMAELYRQRVEVTLGV